MRDCYYKLKERAMKTLYGMGAFIVISLAVISPAFAAPWTAAVTADINSGNYGAINQIVAANPGDAGAIAAFLLGQAQADAGSAPGKSVKLLNTAVPFSSQISAADVGGAVGDVKTLLNLADNAGFQKSDPKGAAQIFAGVINVLSLPNFSNQAPQLQGQAIADAGKFLKDNPDADDKLRDEVSLAEGFDLNGVNPDIDTIRLRKQPFDNGPPSSPTFPPASNP
jgi:hypothetical protein